MVLYKLMVVHWSIFTLFIQLEFCASAFTNFDLDTFNYKSICDEDIIQYVHEKGVGSSLVLNLYPDKSKPFCKRQFHAPESHSFYVRLQKITSPLTTSRKVSQQNGLSKKYGSKKSSNITETCSLSITHSLHGEVLPPWRLDPCELEAANSKDEPMRLLQGRLNIVWNHFGNRPNYRLLITVIGNGPPCLEDNKHACLEVDDVPLLCISSELVCDGIRHCPSPINALSDEDSEMCAKFKEQMLTESPIEMVFRKYIKNTFKSFFYVDSTEVPSTTEKIPPDYEERLDTVENQTKNPKSHRGTLTGLSKYGPWGFLFLGMLLCGGALLLCGLWECCCRPSKPETPEVTSQENPSIYLESAVSSGNANTSGASGQTLPPYDDLDPPPAYAVLFPHQKSSTNLSTVSSVTSIEEGNSDPVQSSSSGGANAVSAVTQTGE